MEGGWREGAVGGGQLTFRPVIVLNFYLVRLPVEGGTIIEPVSFVLRLLADLVLLSIVLGDASFLYKEIWYNQFKCIHVYINLLTCRLAS